MSYEQGTVFFGQKSLMFHSHMRNSRNKKNPKTPNERARDCASFSSISLSDRTNIGGVVLRDPLQKYRTGAKRYGTYRTRAVPKKDPLRRTHPWSWEQCPAADPATPVLGAREKATGLRSVQHPGIGKRERKWPVSSHDTRAREDSKKPW